MLNVTIDYLKESSKTVNNNIGIVGANIIELSSSNKQSNNKKMKFDMYCEYDEINQINNLNLNIDEIYKMINKEFDFYIAKDQFLADIDLKFLINSRCINLVEKYEIYINSDHEVSLAEAYD